MSLKRHNLEIILKVAISIALIDRNPSSEFCQSIQASVNAKFIYSQMPNLNLVELIDNCKIKSFISTLQIILQKIYQQSAQV